MVKKRQPAESHDIEIARDGKRYTGSYTVERGVVRVSYFGHVGEVSKATQLGNSSPARIARLLLSELVAEHRRS